MPGDIRKVHSRFPGCLHQGTIGHVLTQNDSPGRQYNRSDPPRPVLLFLSGPVSFPFLQEHRRHLLLLPGHPHEHPIIPGGAEPEWRSFLHGTAGNVLSNFVSKSDFHERAYNIISSNPRRVTLIPQIRSDDPCMALPGNGSGTASPYPGYFWYRDFPEGKMDAPEMPGKGAGM